MLDIGNIKKGLEEMGIDDPKEIASILTANIENYIYNEKKQKKKEQMERKKEMIKNRFVVPFGKTKIEYKQLKKEVQNNIDNLLIIIRNRPDNKSYPEELKEKYIEMKKKLEFILSTPKNSIDINKAKNYPIDSLIDFRNGFAICPYHDEKTGSLKYYQRSNTCYCFGSCHQKYDSIDIYMKLYNVSLVEAVKKLS